MGDVVGAESPKTLFCKQFEDLHDDSFEGSMDEYRIFREVFFACDSSSNKGFVNTNAVNYDCHYIKPADVSLCSNSGKSSLTSQEDIVKEDFMRKPLTECLSEDLTSYMQSNHRVKLSAGHFPDEKPDLEDVLMTAVPSGGIVSGSSMQNNHKVKLSVGHLADEKHDLEDILIAAAPLGGIVSGLSQQGSVSTYRTLRYCLVESSQQGVTSSCYQLRQNVNLKKECEIKDMVNCGNRLSTLDQNDRKETTSKTVASPISEESHASKLLVIRPSVSVVNKLKTHRPSKPKWKDSCFLRLDEEEFAMPTDIKNDPRPLLRYHINRLLRAAGWVIGRRKRNSKYNGVGEYVYKSPGGRPFREFHRAWCLCGESLLADASDYMQRSDCMQWTDMTALWTDLSVTVKEIDESPNLTETTSAMAHLWCLLDPFAKVVFIDKTIRLLKEGITIKAKRSLLISPDVEPAAKYRKISRLETSGCSPCIRQDFGDDNTCNPPDIRLFDVPIENVPELLGGPETVFPLEDSITSSPSFDLDKPEGVGRFGHIKKARKKSRKISEMKLSGNHFVVRTRYPEGEMNEAICGSKKSKTCGLNDDDLLISAIIKSKTLRPTKKWSSRKPKRLRKRKTPKGSCRLLPRNLNKGSKLTVEGKWSAFESRTVLSWLIHLRVVSPNEIIQYRNLKNDTIIKDGLISRNGIICRCCDKFLSISEFKSHAGFKLNCPCVNLFMESGKPLTLCHLEAWSLEYKSRQRTPQTGQVDEVDQNDDSCGRCGDVGELICCDNCPSAFHQTCLFEQELPEGSWYCPQCRCQICGDAVSDKEPSKLHRALKCSQCEHKYHETCMDGKGKEIGLDSDTWFCRESCSKVYSGLQFRIGLMNLLSDGFSWSLLRCIPGDMKDHSAQHLVSMKAECNSKLAVAITILEECFLPMVDAKTGIDMIPQVIYNWGSQFARLNYGGFYTVILEKDDVVLSVASIRIHGVKVAELPLVATCNKHRRQGMCRRLIRSIEEMLKSLKVEMLVVSAIPTLVDTWTVGFGFQPLEENEKRSLSEINMMVFPGAVWLKKPLYENHGLNEKNGPKDASTSDSTVLGDFEGDGLTPEHDHLSDGSLYVPETNIETGICNGELADMHSTKVLSDGILQKYPTKLSFDEQEPAIPDCNSFAQENTAKYGDPENMGSAEEIESYVFLNQALKLDEQESGQLYNFDLSVEEANSTTKTPFHMVLSNEEHHFGLLQNGCSKDFADVQDCGFFRDQVFNPSSDQPVSPSQGSQVKVIFHAEHPERQKQFAVPVENNALL
ncbi:increased DNA methylation 1 [Henckelia pumila]|uniref:increased DNA methylation 1 n=1 Tax=Henckelia pumila TaxID=405737 RepID=UPI003C6E4EDD